MRNPVLAFSILLVFAAAGCQQQDRSTVSGKVVRHDGTPLVGARVMARSGDGTSPYGLTDAEGQFTLGVAEHGDGVPPGTYQVGILEDRGEYGERTPATIPDKYKNPAQSGLSLTVDAGESKEFNVTLDPL